LKAARPAITLRQLALVLAVHVATVQSLIYKG
jgi:hypothetical protein